jgi:hypothetical protein
VGLDGPVAIDDEGRDARFGSVQEGGDERGEVHSRAGHAQPFSVVLDDDVDPHHHLLQPAIGVGIDVEGRGGFERGEEPGIIGFLGVEVIARRQAVRRVVVAVVVGAAGAAGDEPGMADEIAPIPFGFECGPAAPKIVVFVAQPVADRERTREVACERDFARQGPGDALAV